MRTSSIVAYTRSSEFLPLGWPRLISLQKLMGVEFMTLIYFAWTPNSVMC